MPTYQYACTECGHAFEQFQSFSDDALTVCPECEGRLRKVFNAVGVVFKGSGLLPQRQPHRRQVGASGASSSADSPSTSDRPRSRRRPRRRSPTRPATEVAEKQVHRPSDPGSSSTAGSHQRRLSRRRSRSLWTGTDVTRGESS